MLTYPFIFGYILWISFNLLFYLEKKNFFLQLETMFKFINSEVLFKIVSRIVDFSENIR